MQEITGVRPKELVDFREALKLLAGRYGIKSDNESQSGKRIEPKTVSPDEKPGDYHIKTKDKPTEKELEILGPMVREETMKRYSYYSVEWYEWVKWDEEKGRKVKYRVTAGDDFPIFMHDCGTFKKIYKPLEQDKGHRFAILGEKTADYINGLDELRRAYQEHSKSMEAEEEAAYDEKKTPDTGRAKKSGKLPEAVICSGEGRPQLRGHGLPCPVDELRDLDTQEETVRRDNAHGGHTVQHTRHRQARNAQGQGAGAAVP